MAHTGPGRLWGNAVASYGMLQDHIARQVPLGIFTDQNRADTDGQSLALALRGGGDFNFGSITTGPVAGVALQQVRLNGFTETGTSGVTALSFGSDAEFARQPAWLVRGAVSAVVVNPQVISYGGELGFNVSF